MLNLISIIPSVVYFPRLYALYNIKEQAEFRCHTIIQKICIFRVVDWSELGHVTTLSFFFIVHLSSFLKVGEVPITTIFTGGLVILRWFWYNTNLLSQFETKLNVRRIGTKIKIAHRNYSISCHHIVCWLSCAFSFNFQFSVGHCCPRNTGLWWPFVPDFVIIKSLFT